MSKAQREKPLYQRGEFRLYPRAGRNHEIVWYDDQRKRERSVSAGTTDERLARIKLDNEYVKKHGGVPRCSSCGQALSQAAEYAAVLIANYKETKPKGDAVHPRLDHVIRFLEETGRVEDRCDALDERWAVAFRDWMRAREDRQRSPGTIENSLIQLAAALRFGGVTPSFETIPTAQVNRTPQHRATIADLAAMFRFCLQPEGRSEKERQRRRREREYLLRYLRAAVATWARPDAVHDISTSRDRSQWHPSVGVLSLNPVGRKQTRKYRATIPVARQFVPHLSEVEGFYIPTVSVRSAWDSMAIAIGLPDEGQAGMKLIRRSMAHIARKRLGEEHWVQGQIFLGHHKASTSDLYALFDPVNLGRALAVTEGIIDEIEDLAPGAFYRAFTAEAGNVVPLRGG